MQQQTFRDLHTCPAVDSRYLIMAAGTAGLHFGPNWLCHGCVGLCSDLMFRSALELQSVSVARKIPKGG